MKIFFILIFGTILSFITYFKNFNLLLFFLRTIWISSFLILIFNPFYEISFKKMGENIILFDKSFNMNYGKKIEEGENFIKKIKGNYKIIEFKDDEEEKIINFLKNKNFSEILLISDGNFSEKIKNFLENINTPINVYTFPDLDIKKKLKVNLPKFVSKNEEFLIEIYFDSTQKGKGEIEIKTDERSLKKEIEIEKGENYFDFKFSFKKEGKKNIKVCILKNGEREEKEFEIMVFKKSPEILIICEKPLPVLKILRDFIKRKIREDIEIFVKVSEDKILKINEKVEKENLPEKTDWLIIVSPVLTKDYKKLISSKKIFYFYEGMESEEIKGKGILEGKNFMIEISENLKLFSKKIKGKEKIIFKGDSKEIPVVLENDRETHVIFTNLFEILFKSEKEIIDTILSEIFKEGELKNPEIFNLILPENIVEDKEFYIKCLLLTPLLKPCFDANLNLKIDKKMYPMIYEGNGIYSSPGIILKRGDYNFEIIVKRREFENKINGNLKVFEKEIKEGVDREYLSYLAKKTGGKEVKREFEFKGKKFFEKKYGFDLRKTLLSYIFITLFFGIEIFFRKKKGYL